MEPTQLELFQSLQTCVVQLQANCNHIKSSLDAMIKALHSINQSLSLVADVELQEPPPKRPKIEGDNTDEAFHARSQEMLEALQFALHGNRNVEPVGPVEPHAESDGSED